MLICSKLIFNHTVFKHIIKNVTLTLIAILKCHHYKFMRSLFINLFLLLLYSPIYAESHSAEWYFSQGKEFYEKEDYEAAVHSFAQAVKKQANNSVFHHWLGKGYGRLADDSGWFKAMELSEKTLKELERAVEIDGNNIDALVDLMDYYRQAPGFLGGSNDKANAIQAKLESLGISESDQ